MAADAMAMKIARLENNYYLYAFADGNTSQFIRRWGGDYDMMPLNITAADSIADAMAKTDNLPWGGHRLRPAYARRREKEHPGGLVRHHHRQ